MSLHIEDKAPDFRAKTTLGEIHFYDWVGDSWCMLFSHPAAFTPVCTTELGRVSSLMGDFKKRDIKVIGLSVDDEEKQKQWVCDINETQKTTLEYPIICDTGKAVANLYNMIPSNGSPLTIRAVYLIDPEKKVKMILIYPNSTGRNFEEVLRAIDSIQLAEKHDLVTPVGWKAGEDCIIPPNISKEESAKKFPGGKEKGKDYLRYTPHPK